MLNDLEQGREHYARRVGWMRLHYYRGPTREASSMAKISSAWRRPHISPDTTTNISPRSIEHIARM